MASASYPDDLSYHAEHGWVRVEGDTGTFGVTWYAQDTLGEVVYVNLPAVGATTTQGEPYGELESVKAVSDVIAPMSGEVIAVNGELASAPEAVNDDPYVSGWLIRVRLSDPAEAAALLNEAGYEATLG